MGVKRVVNIIDLEQKKGVFVSIIDKIKGRKQSKLVELRQILSNEKARLLHTIKTKNPNSIYELSKLLSRDFNAVRYDIRILEKLGFVELISSRNKKRESLKPIVNVDQVVIKINL